MAKIIRQGDGRYAIRTTGSDRIIHIETPQGIINVHLNLTDEHQNPVTNVSVIPDSIDANGSPISVILLDQNDRNIEQNGSIRMILNKNKTQQKLPDEPATEQNSEHLHKNSDIIIAS